MRDSLEKQGFRLFGAPPPKGAPKVEAWEYVRRIYIRSLPFMAPVWVIIGVYGQTWAWIVLLFSAVTWLLGFTSVSLRIKRLRNGSPDGPP